MQLSDVLIDTSLHAFLDPAFNSLLPLCRASAPDLLSKDRNYPPFAVEVKRDSFALSQAVHGALAAQVYRDHCWPLAVEQTEAHAGIQLWASPRFAVAGLEFLGAMALYEVDLRGPIKVNFRAACSHSEVRARLADIQTTANAAGVGLGAAPTVTIPVPDATWARCTNMQTGFIMWTTQAINGNFYKAVSLDAARKQRAVALPPFETMAVVYDRLATKGRARMLYGPLCVVVEMPFYVGRHPTEDEFPFHRDRLKADLDILTELDLEYTDFRPENIIVGADDMWHLVDFDDCTVQPRRKQE